MIDHDVSLGSHEALYAIIGSQSQPETSDNRDCVRGCVGEQGRMVDIKTKQPEAIEVLTRLDALGLSQRALAGKLDVAENKVSKIRSGERRISATEYRIAMEWLEEVERRGGYVEQPDLPDVDAQRDYLPIAVLPSYAGMGGGGTGDGDLETALVPRSLVEDELKAKPSDLMLLEARGQSMEPDFLHGDQLLIDLRDKNPVQPGAFALWDGDGYVVKLVERVPNKAGFYRIFSANERFSAYEVEATDVQIMGRPVWFGRRL